MQTEDYVELMEDLAVDVGPITDRIDINCIESHTSRDGSTVKNVHVLGFTSKNGYKYSSDAVQEAVNKYNNVDVYTNHRNKKESRKVEDKFGFLENARFDEQTGIWADLCCNEKHPFFEQFMWWVENKPNQVGLSHDAGGKFNKKAGLVEAITHVKSVDIVASPATVGGLCESFKEGVISDKIDAEKVHQRFNEVINAAVDLITQHQFDFNESVQSRAVSVRQVAEDLVSIMGDFDQANANLDPANTTEESHEGEEMKWEDIDLASLNENRPELVESIRKDQDAVRDARDTKLSEALKDVPEKLQTEFFTEMCVDAIAKNDDDQLKKLVENQKALAATASKPVSTGVVETKEDKKEKKEETNLEENEKKTVFSAITKYGK